MRPRPGSAPGYPRRAIVATLGAAGGLGALALPWMAGRQPGIGTLLGYQDALPWVALRVAVAVACLVAALRVIPIPDRRETERVLYGAAAVLFVLRPVVLVASNPTSADFRRMNADIGPIYSPSWGILASLLAGALMLVAAVLTHRSDDAATEAARVAAREALLLDPELAAFASDGPVVPAPPPTPAPLAVTVPADPPSPVASDEAAATSGASVAPPGFAA